MADQKLRFYLLFGEIVAKKIRVLMGLPTLGEGAVNPAYTCRTPCDVFTLFFMVRSHSHSQPDMAELSRNSGLKLTRTLHPPVHTVFFSTAQEDGAFFFLLLLFVKMLLCGLICQGTQGTLFPVLGYLYPRTSLCPPHQSVHFSLVMVVDTGNSPKNWKMNSELDCRECQLTKITLPKQCLYRFTAPRASVDGLEAQENGFEKERHPPAVQLTPKR